MTQGARRILVMAQGEASRLPGKHFALINGEQLLHRTLRLCRELGAQDIVVVGWNTEPFTKLGVKIHTQQDPGKGLLDGVWNTRALWTQHTTILLGDVVFSRSALKKCLHQRSFAFFGRSGPNKHTGCSWGEIFGIYLDPKGRQVVTKEISAPPTRQLRDGRLWGLWDRVRGRSSWCSIDDWTDDIDFPADLEAIRRIAPLIARDS